MRADTVRRSAGALLLALLAAACQPRGDEPVDTPAEADGHTAAVEVRDAFALDALGSEQMAVYATLVNEGPGVDTLRALESPMAGTASLHAMIMEGGMMRMRPLAGVEIPASDTVRLRPGDLHGMLEGVREPPSAGDTIEVTFRFSRAPPRTVRVPVRDPADVGGG